jgi:hypothetical protein
MPAASVLGLRGGVSGAVLALVHHVLAELRRAGALLPVRRPGVVPPGSPGGRGGGRFRGGRGRGGRVEERERRRRVQALGALEHVLPADHRVDVVVVGEVVPHEPVPVAPAFDCSNGTCHGTVQQKRATTQEQE